MSHREGGLVMKGRKHITRFTIVMALAVLAVGVFAGAALAVGDDTNLELGGTTDVVMDAVTIGDFTHVHLSNAAAATTQADATTFNVTDQRGTGAGWYVSFTATELIGTGEETEHALGTGLIKLQHLAEPSENFVAGSVPTIDTEIDGDAEELAIDEGEETIAFAAASDGEINGQGMGSYLFPAAHVHVTIPRGAYACTYKSTLTVTLYQSAPLE